MNDIVSYQLCFACNKDVMKASGSLWNFNGTAHKSSWNTGSNPPKNTGSCRITPQFIGYITKYEEHWTTSDWGTKPYDEEGEAE